MIITPYHRAAVFIESHRTLDEAYHLFGSAVAIARTEIWMFEIRRVKNRVRCSKSYKNVSYSNSFLVSNVDSVTKFHTDQIPQFWNL